MRLLVRVKLWVPKSENLSLTGLKSFFGMTWIQYHEKKFGFAIGNIVFDNLAITNGIQKKFHHREKLIKQKISEIMHIEKQIFFHFDELFIFTELMP